MRIFAVKLLLFFLLLSTPALSEVITGMVVNIADGDTITILDSSKNQHKIRLFGIDAPEKAQPFGNAAKKFTSSLAASKIAKVIVYDTDRYGRSVGVVIVDGKNVNQSLIKEGLAWQYRTYCKKDFCRDWLQAEKIAQISKVGLWADNDPVPPWDWRKGARNSSYSKKDTSSTFSHDTGSYHGNLSSHVFHSSNCRNYNCKNCTKTFINREAAVSAGYRPCGQCKP